MPGRARTAACHRAVLPSAGRRNRRDEWAAELSNGTVHAVLHLAWVEQGDGRHRGQMGVYIKPRGKLGATYMALIRPFR